MSFNDVVMFIMAIGIIAGAIDKIIGNRLGLGKELEEGFKNIGVIGITIIGVISISPLLANLIAPYIVPLYKSVGIDPAMFGVILANDMGGYNLCVSLAENEAIGLLAGTTIAAMIGGTLVFNIPVGLGMVEEKDKKFFLKGVIIGMIAMPIGSIIAGLFYGISFKLLLINSIPLIICAGIMIIGTLFFQELFIKLFVLFGKLMMIIAVVGIALSAFTHLTGIVIIKGLNPLTKGADVLINIGVILMGSYPIIKIFKWILAKPFEVVGKKLGLNGVSMLGFIVSLANSVPIFSMIKDMNPKGKVLNSAWLVCASPALGAHLGFTLGVAPKMISIMLVGKISAGLIALLIASLTNAEKSA